VQFPPGMGIGLTEVPSFIDLGRFPTAIYQNLYRAVNFAGCDDLVSFRIFTLSKSRSGKLPITGGRFFRSLTTFRTAVSDLAPSAKRCALSSDRSTFEICFIFEELNHVHIPQCDPGAQLG